MQDLISLRRGLHNGILINPQRLSRRVWISPAAFLRLRSAQEALPPPLRFILLRGYEPGSRVRRAVRHLLRKFGGVVFQTVFPDRSAEVCQIFHPNGHNIDGNHIDVALALNGKRLRPLPFGVFTPGRLVARSSRNTSIDSAWKALSSVGFQVHGNPTEALQIHCDLC